MIRKLILTAAAVALVCLMAATRTANAGDCAAGCAPAAPACCDSGMKKVCQPISDVKKVNKVVDSQGCEDFCVPHCSLTGGLFKWPKKKGCAEQPECNTAGTCDSCANGNCAKCGKVHTRKYLVIKVKTHEECVTKCVVGYEPCNTAKTCELPCAVKPCETTGIIEAPSPAMPTAPGPEKLPIAPMPEKKMQPEKH